MTAETTMVMFEMLIGPALEMRRQQESLTIDDRAGLQCDGFTGNEAELRGHAIRRERWSTDYNCALPLKKKRRVVCQGQCVRCAF